MQNNVVTTDRMWARLLSSTNQPSFLTPKDIMEQGPTEVVEDQLCTDDCSVEEEIK